MEKNYFTEIRTGKKTTIKDEHEIVQIQQKNVVVGDVGKIIAGEINSQQIEFSIPRYYDGVDLLRKHFYILYETKGGIYKSDAVNISYNNTEIRFNWLLGEDATKYAGEIQAFVGVEGTHDKTSYVLKTTNFSLQVEKSLCEYGVEGVYHSWANDIEKRIDKLERATQNTSICFVGTLDEYNKACLDGSIKSGMIITLTDE